MKPPLRRVLRPALVVLGAVLVELVLERVLAQGDPIGSLLLGKVTSAVVVAPVLLLLRIALIVLAPGWLLTKAVAGVLERTALRTADGAARDRDEAPK